MEGDMLVVVGFSRTLLDVLARRPQRRVTVIEEPSVIANRNLEDAAAASPCVTRLLACEYQLPGRLERLLADTPELTTARAVLPGIEYAVPGAARLADALGLPGAGNRAATIFRDKRLQRLVAATVNIHQPRSRVVRTLQDAEAFLKTGRGPVVLKPSARQAGLGVVVVADRGELARVGLTHTRSADEPLLVPDRGICSQVLIEDLLVGEEFSVEMLLEDGVPLWSNVTHKQVLSGAYPVEMGHVVPADVPESLAASMTDSTALLAAAARFGTGVLHCEWILEDGKPALVECAARLPGDEITTLVERAYDFGLVDAYVDLLSGRTPTCPAQPVGATAIRFLTSSPGLVHAVSGIELAARMPGVEHVRLSAGVGTHVGPVTSSWDRLGHVIAVGVDPAQAESRAAAAAAVVHIGTRPAPAEAP